VLDVVLYVLLLVSLVVAVAPAGVVTRPLAAALPGNTTGLVDPVLLIAPVVLLVLVGCGTRHLPRRAGRAVPARAVSSSPRWPFVDMIIALKLLIVVVWVGAGSPSSASTSPTWFPRWSATARSCRSSGLKRAHYRDYPTDIRPSRVGDLMAHVGGTTVEIALPWCCCSPPTG